MSIVERLACKYTSFCLFSRPHTNVAMIIGQTSVLVYINRDQLFDSSSVSKIHSSHLLAPQQTLSTRKCCFTKISTTQQTISTWKCLSPISARASRIPVAANFIRYHPRDWLQVFEGAPLQTSSSSTPHPLQRCTGLFSSSAIHRVIHIPWLRSS